MSKVPHGETKHNSWPLIKPIECNKSQITPLNQVKNEAKTYNFKCANVVYNTLSKKAIDNLKGNRWRTEAASISASITLIQILHKEQGCCMDEDFQRFVLHLKDIMRFRAISYNFTRISANEQSDLAYRQSRTKRINDFIKRKIGYFRIL